MLNKVKKISKYVYLPFILVLFINLNAFADTIQLKDGSLLVGKIITRKKGKMTFSNSYGIFSFKIKKIKKEYHTKNYKQDIIIFKELGHPITPELIRNIRSNYQEGEKKKAKIEKNETDEKKIKNEMEKDDKRREEELRKLKEKAEKKRLKKEKRRAREIKRRRIKSQRNKSNHWINGRLYFSGSFLYTFSQINDALPYGFTGNFAIDQGLDMAIKKRFAMMPGIRFEFGYIYFKQGAAEISGYSAYTGLCWALPSMKNSWGNLYLALLPGIAFIDIEKVKSDYKARSTTVTAEALFGYQYSIGVFSVFIHVKYLYIYDKDVLFNTLGFEAGIGFNAW